MHIGVVVPLNGGIWPAHRRPVTSGSMRRPWSRQHFVTWSEPWQPRAAADEFVAEHDLADTGGTCAAGLQLVRLTEAGPDSILDLLGYPALKK